MDSGGLKSKRSELLPHLIIIATFCFLLSQTWLKWGDLVVDTGRELWLPGELLKGKILYKDIVSFYGFLPPYLIAELYRLFGTSVNTLVYTGIALTLIVSFTVYRIGRFFLDQLFSTILVINFLFVFAFGYYFRPLGIDNFILPYAFASTFFMTFTALSLYFFLKFIFLGSEKNLIVWALFLTAAFLCRPESALTMWPAFGLSGFILAIRQQKIQCFKILFYTFLPLLLAALCYGLFFRATHTFHAFKEIFLGSIKFTADTPLNSIMAGINNTAFNILQVFLSFLVNIAIFINLGALCRIPEFLSNNRSYARTIIPIFITFIFFLLLAQYSLYMLQYHCLILILLCGTSAYFFQSLNPGASKHTLGLLTLFATSLLLMYRIFLAPPHYGYGFFISTIPLICYYIFFSDLLKTALEKRFNIPAAMTSMAIAVFLTLMITPLWKHSADNYADRNKYTATSKGGFYCIHSVKTDFFWKTVDYLKKNTPKNSTVVVFPEGVGINFFSERATPLRHHTFLPLEIRLFGEDKIISEMQAAKIDYIVILTRDSSEFGRTLFGIDYAAKIQKLVNSDYMLVKQFYSRLYVPDNNRNNISDATLNNALDEFSIVIFRKKNKNYG